MLSFERLPVAAADGSRARLGRLRTPHGVALTPAFLPVGTYATVRALGPDDLAAVGAQIVLTNTYHLHLRPGANVVAALGRLHRFKGWRRPVITDFGGFQVLSLAARRVVDDDGVTFRSHLDGAPVRLRPKVAMAALARYGAARPAEVPA